MYMHHIYEVLFMVLIMPDSKSSKSVPEIDRLCWIPNPAEATNIALMQAAGLGRQQAIQASCVHTGVECVINRNNCHLFMIDTVLPTKTRGNSKENHNDCKHQQEHKSKR